MNHLNAYADKYNRDHDNNFAIACYDMNSLDELVAETGEPDKQDCREWGISGDEWRAAIDAAIRQKIEDGIEDSGFWVSWRDFLGLSQSQAAHSLGISKRHYQGIESGLSAPSMSVIRVAASKLGAEVLLEE